MHWGDTTMSWPIIITELKSQHTQCFKMAHMFKHIAISFTCLFLIWILLSGCFKSNLVILGLLSCTLVTILSVAYKVYSPYQHRLAINLRLPFYLPWLLLEIIKSNLHVARCILTNNIQPQTLRIKPKQKTDAGLAVHANSITLTPGTISVDYSSEQLLVHALTHHTAEGVKSDEMNIKIASLENLK